MRKHYRLYIYIFLIYEMSIGVTPAVLLTKFYVCLYIHCIIVHFAGDIQHRIKIFRQTTGRLYPQSANSMSPSPRRLICIIRYIFVFK